MSGTLQGLSANSGNGGVNLNASLIAIGTLINNQQVQNAYGSGDQIGQNGDASGLNQLLSAPPAWCSNQNAGYSGNAGMGKLNLGDICQLLEQAVQDQQNDMQNAIGSGNNQQSCGPTGNYGNGGDYGNYGGRRKKNRCGGDTHGRGGNDYGNSGAAKGFPGFNGGGSLVGNTPRNAGFGGQFTGNYGGNYNGGPVGVSTGTGSSAVDQKCRPKPAPVCQPPVQNACPPPVKNDCPPPRDDCRTTQPVAEHCKPKGFEATNGFSFKSVGDPHVETSVNGGKTVKKDVNQDIPNFSVVKDTKGGATKTSTETTPKDANGVAYNDEVNLKHGGKNGWDIAAKRSQDGKSVDATFNQRNGTSTKLVDNASITTPDGETIAMNGGKLTVAQATSHGGKVESTVSANGGGLDLVQNGTGGAILEGAALDQALTA